MSLTSLHGIELRLTPEGGQDAFIKDLLKIFRDLFEKRPTSETLCQTPTDDFIPFKTSSLIYFIFRRAVNNSVSQKQGANVQSIKNNFFNQFWEFFLVLASQIPYRSQDGSHECQVWSEEREILLQVLKGFEALPTLQGQPQPAVEFRGLPRLRETAAWVLEGQHSKHFTRLPISDWESQNRLNLETFLAQLTKDGAEDFSNIACLTFQEVLEEYYNCDLTLFNAKLDAKLYLVQEWMKIARERLFEHVELETWWGSQEYCRGTLWNAIGKHKGFNLARWQLWKTRFEALASCNARYSVTGRSTRFVSDFTRAVGFMRRKVEDKERRDRKGEVADGSKEGVERIHELSSDGSISPPTEPKPTQEHNNVMTPSPSEARPTLREIGNQFHEDWMRSHITWQFARPATNAPDVDSDWT